MIEKTVLKYLNDKLDFPIFMEEPKNPPSHYYLMEKTAGGQNDRIFNSTLTVQSYAPSMLEAAELNDELKTVMLEAYVLPEVTRVRLNSDYNYTDTTTKRYRYQAVFNLIHYRKDY